MRKECKDLMSVCVKERLCGKELRLRKHPRVLKSVLKEKKKINLSDGKTFVCEANKRQSGEGGKKNHHKKPKAGRHEKNLIFRWKRRKVGYLVSIYIVTCTYMIYPDLIIAFFFPSLTYFLLLLQPG